MKHEMTLKRAEKIADDYVCNRCWNNLEVIETGPETGYPICSNSQKGLCDGGTGFISNGTLEIMKEIDENNYMLVKKSYPQWN